MADGYSVKIDGTRATIMPRSPRRKRGVVLSHPVGGDQTTWTSASVSPISLAVASYLASNGIICVASALGGDQWGNDTAVAALDADFAALQAAGAASDGFCVYGISMGHAVAVRYPAAHPGKLKGVYATAPVISIEDIWDNKRVGSWANIGVVWGNTTWPATLPSGADLISQAPTGIPWQIDYGTADDVCLPSFVPTYASAAGASCSTRVIDTTNVHSQTLFSGTSPANVLAFMIANGC